MIKMFAESFVNGFFKKMGLEEAWERMKPFRQNLDLQSFTTTGNEHDLEVIYRHSDGNRYSAKILVKKLETKK